MKCIAALDVDFERTSIGTRSRLADDMVGRAVLTRTLERVASAERIERVFLLCPPERVETCRAFVPAELGQRVVVQARRVESRPFADIVRVTRKWSLDSWRGGIGGTCYFDEFARSDELALLAQAEEADTVFCAPAAAPLLDSDMIDEMIDYNVQTAHESRITFAQAPPGLAGVVFSRDILYEMGEKRVPPGIVLSYKPDAPMMDLAFKSCCFTAPAAVRHAGGRLVVDTDRSWKTVEDFLSSSQPTNAEAIGSWLIHREERHVPPLPREVEIELTTEDELSETRMRPRGSRVGDRGLIDPDIVRRVAGELASLDDSLVVFGGFGEPLLHPQFDEIVTCLRSAGVYGIAVRTNALNLTDEHIETLIRCEVDVVSALLDAWTPELYRCVHGREGLEQATANVRRLSEQRCSRKVSTPVVVPEMTKCVETMDEMDAFFDGWVREVGWANISGFSHCAGQLEDRGVTIMAPPVRRACGRLNSRVMVLADGSVIRCDQDFSGIAPLGSLADDSLADVWIGNTIATTRTIHREGRFHELALCGACDDWHRP